ncbi:YifB family Mg chelatase-like AAA ATPase [Tessaracoccus flavus]|uniref:YifB family Mg chelatase-like AAA ATPase n=1 Tax=Tessaracoccus flavus TaxID=1610493 RepID=UPI000897C1A6|nr:YifB family Mg chelatase-like AAA ATPase [Tessaracoccus flavus]SDY96553.1 magnesium chelatase family protein [Tessaracoccus flavus]
MVRAWSVGLTGINGFPVEVEAALGGGLPRVQLVGLPDTSLSEAKHRVRAAVTSAGWPWPDRLITFNLSPASLPKTGTHYDLALAVTALIVQKELAETHARTVLFGELSLDGRVRKVRGVLPAMLAAVKAGFDRAIVPAGQQAEASLVPGLTVWGAGTLREVVDIIEGRPVLEPTEAAPSSTPGPDLHSEFAPDLRDVVGHEDGKFALEVAAAGRHHLFLYGAPGVGKTMLASRLPSILPDLDEPEAVEVSALHSLAGRELTGLIKRPPYADPHSSMSTVALVGGGAGELRPGAISLAHRGVLFLDECPDFGGKLDALRTPLENGWINVSRAKQSTRFPARFQLVLAANPCPCGMHGVAGMQCRCDPTKVRRYQEQLTGPVLDRIDIRHQMASVNRVLLDVAAGTPESSAEVLARVVEARDRQRRRLRDTPWLTNGDVSGAYLRQHLALPDDIGILNTALQRGLLSARGVDKVLRVAWTMADLSGSDVVTARELRAALQLRQGELRGAA